MTRVRCLATVIAAIVVFGACSDGSPPASTASQSSASSLGSDAPSNAAPCGHSAQPPARYDHVIWIWMENHAAGDVIGSGDAPFETMLARQCGTATRYRSVGSPSLPNYVGATSGDTQGITDDGAPTAHPLTVDNLFRQVRTSGRRERSYQEDMPSPCALQPEGRYAVKHNPAAYYSGSDDRAACQADDLTMGSDTAGAFASDLASDALPAFAFITPNLCNDTHDCPVSVGDAWLALWLPKILSSPAYGQGRTVVFVVWDEPTPMPNIIISPTTPSGTTFHEPVDHYSLLRTTEELLGLPLLGAATGATSLREPFRL
jgi:hypothetical protein